MTHVTFYMVYLEGERSPVCKHQTLQIADVEAKRLARTYHKPAYILQAIKRIELNEFTEKMLVKGNDPPYEIPF